MTTETSLESLKELLAEAMLFGTRLADNGYQGLLPDRSNGPVLQGIDKLHAAAAAFLKTTDLHGVTPEQVLPLYQEVREITLQGA
jgi:hypothetical protein